MISDFADRNTMIYGHNLKIGGEMFLSVENEYESEMISARHILSFIFIHRMEKYGCIKYLLLRW